MTENQTEKPSPKKARIADIRDIALAQLFDPREGFDMPRYEAELMEVASGPKDRNSTMFYEAFILLVVGAGKRPRRAQKSLYRLFKARTAAKEVKQFEYFAALLRGAVSRKASIEGLYFPQAFEVMDHETVWADVGKVLNRVQDVVGPLFLNSGTLLGVVRDQSLIPHDDDVDLAVILDADNPEAAAHAWIEVKRKLDAAGLLARRQGPNPGAYKLQSDGVYNIDLFPAWIADGHVNVYPHTCGELAQDQLVPLAKCAVTGLPIPADPEAMLEVNYGSGWRHPDPSFGFPWNRANRRFAAFLDALAVATPETVDE